MEVTDPYGNDYTTLEHLPDEYKKDVIEWLQEARKNQDNFWMKDKSAEFKEGYQVALNHLEHSMDKQEWI